MANMNLKGKLYSAYLGASRVFFLLLAANVLLLPPMSSAGPIVDKWFLPCGVSPSTSGSTLAGLLGEMRDSARDAQTAAAGLKRLLNAPVNPRVDNDTVDSLNNFNMHIENFPHSVVKTVDSQTNITELLYGDYRNMSKMYIFLGQSIVNSQACDTRSNASSLQHQMAVIQQRLLATLCGLAKYLAAASGQPMPEDQIPGKTEVLEASVPNVGDIPQSCSEGSDVSYRNQADYLIARDTEDAMGHLYARYLDLHSSVSSNSSS